MIQFQEYENSILLGESLVCLVDDLDESASYGYVKSIEKINYNISLLDDVLKNCEFETCLSNSKKGLTTLFPLGRYIVTLRVKKDKTEMEMLFLNFRIYYADIDLGLSGYLSENGVIQFKRIKYDMEEWYDKSFDNIYLSKSLYY